MVQGGGTVRIVNPVTVEVFGCGGGATSGSRNANPGVVNLNGLAGGSGGETRGEIGKYSFVLPTLLVAIVPKFPLALI
jgi:hypothetical protein